jgi:hypothetical protein
MLLVLLFSLFLLKGFLNLQLSVGTKQQLLSTHNKCVQLDVSSITPTKRTLYIQYISVEYFSCMFQSISYHLQGELMYSLLKTIGFYKATVCGRLAALLYSTFTMVKYFLHAIPNITSLKKNL